MPFIDADGLTLHYTRHGSGPIPVVLVHGNFASARWWASFAKRLPAEDFTAFAVDMRGCGQSDKPSDGFGIPRLAHDLRAWTDALGLPPFHLVGHSLGGAVALQMTLDCPAHTRSLTLLSPSPADGLEGLRDGEGELARLIRLWDPQHQPSMNVLSAALHWGRATGASRRRLRDSLRRMMPTANLDAAEFAALLDDAEHLSPDTVVGFYRALHRWDIRDRLETVRSPTWIVGGALDPIVPRAALAILAGHIPRARLDLWNDVGHAPQLEAPARLADAYDAFVVALSWRVRALRWLRRWGFGGWGRWLIQRTMPSQRPRRAGHPMPTRRPSDSAERNLLPSTVSGAPLPSTKDC